MKRSIKVDAVSKRYELGLTHAGSIRELANRWAGRIAGRKQSVPNPAARGREDFKGAQRPAGGEFWALKDVSFEIGQGEVVGIIGKNGAGKSTLLKLLSRITYPTTGRMELSGRVASLLEVGTGFHPELTGRENISLNAAILGMTRREAARQLDSIVDFSGVEEFLDTPVKRYSSGMTVRLGFAVAAHLDPEILIVDEVLAVGDIEFQKRCIGKMQNIADSGRTVLFVSHNLASIRSLTTRTLVLTDGTLTFDGPTPEGITRYISENLVEEDIQKPIAAVKRTMPGLDQKLRIVDLKLDNRNPDGAISWDGLFQLTMSVSAHEICRPFMVAMTIFANDETAIGNSFSEPLSSPTVGCVEDYTLRANFPLAPGRYYCGVSIVSERSGGTELHDSVNCVLPFEVPERPLDEFAVDRSWIRGWGFFRLEALRMVEKQ